ncbi:MAG: DUF6159 family protein [Acidimicrobiales bacterium]
MGRFSRSLELAKASWRTLKADRELLALPLFSFVASIVVIAIGAGLVFLVDYDTAQGFENFELSPAGIIVLILMSMTVAVVATFFQAAMVGGARERLTGGDPTVASAMGVATARLAVIVPWALFSWTVGAVLRLIEQNAGVVGRFVVGLLGMAFRVVTFLAVPILVVESLGPINTLKRSGELFKRTWGENLIAQAGLGLVTVAAIIPIMLVAGIFGAAVSPVFGVIVAIPLVAVVAVVMTSLTAIFQTALYHYVTTDEIPSGFEGAGLETAFKTK